MSAQKHVFFDLDNTLTPSKSLIEEKHIPLFRKLCELKDVIVVSGHGEKDIKNHLGLVGSYYILGQNGNRAEMKDGSLLWNNSLSHEQKGAIMQFIAKARVHLAYKVSNENDIMEDRDSQIAFSLIGHHEDKKIKDAFDPGGAKRRKLMKDMKDDLDALKKVGVEMTIGGTTNLDIYQYGKNKGYNVREFLKKMDWDKDDCLYIGDALFPGGNDETVIGVIPTHAVKDYNETYEFIEKELLK
jgi:phosphomannomutase